LRTIIPIHDVKTIIIGLKAAIMALNKTFIPCDPPGKNAAKYHNNATN
jgi:hypothetical protein